MLCLPVANLGSSSMLRLPSCYYLPTLLGFKPFSDCIGVNPSINFFDKERL